MQYRKVAVLGARAVGSYLIWGLSKKKDIEVKNDGKFDYSDMGEESTCSR